MVGSSSAFQLPPSRSFSSADGISYPFVYKFAEYFFGSASSAVGTCGLREQQAIVNDLIANNVRSDRHGANAA